MNTSGDFSFGATTSTSCCSTLASQAPTTGLTTPTPSSHHTRRVEETRKRWFDFLRNLNGSKESVWSDEMEQQLCHLLHDDFLYELPGTSNNGSSFLTRNQMIYCVRQMKHMRCVATTEWMIEAATSSSSSYGQVQALTSFKLPTTPAGLSQYQCVVATLAEDGRILHVQPKESMMTQILALQADFLSLVN